jgi:hypothetical protein
MTLGLKPGHRSKHNRLREGKQTQPLQGCAAAVVSRRMLRCLKLAAERGLGTFDFEAIPARFVPL